VEGRQKDPHKFLLLGSNQSTPKHCNYRFVRVCTIASLARLRPRSDGVFGEQQHAHRKVAGCFAIIRC
jgi:hypothetical protein